MDVAYDHIQEETFPEDQEGKTQENDNRRTSTFNVEFQEAFKAVSNSPWATRLGGFWGNVRKQGEHYYEEAQKEYQSASQTASKGLTGLINRTRALSLKAPEAESSKDTTGEQTGDEAEKSKGDADAPAEQKHKRAESLSKDIVAEASILVSGFRTMAEKRLKDIQRAEDAADEALLKFGTNIRNFLRDAVTVAPPPAGSSADANGTDATRSMVLFESKDSEGKRVIHTTRFDAQLHAIHSSLVSFEKDPISPQWGAWCKSFDVEKKTEDIARDLERYEELRRAMERCVPEKVEYQDFWRRYYFLRHVVEIEEQKRREMLNKAATAEEEEEVGWDEDSDTEEEEDDDEEDEDEEDDDDDDDDDDESSTPGTHPLAASKDTLKPTPGAEPRRSHDMHSQADSDASYDLVSGASTRATGSPREKKTQTVVEESSDEEDWE